MAADLTPLAPGPLSEAVTQLGVELRSSSGVATAVAAESGLHPDAASASLLDWAQGLTRPAMEALVATGRRPPNPVTRLVTLAPGNVPIVAAECLLLGLLAGGRHTLALSTRGSAVAIALAAHLRRLSPDLDERVELVVWRHLTATQRRAVLGGATRVVAYGTAQTVEWVAGMTPPDAVIVPHGPSLALSYVDPETLAPDRLDMLANALALDVARWDQRGCRSPHAVFVVGDLGAARSFAERLAYSAFPAVASVLPRGRLTASELATTYLDGLTSAALGVVLPSRDAVVTLEDRPAVLRPSPLGRTVRVVAVEGPAQLAELAATLPAPVGTLAVAGTDANGLLEATAPLERVAFGALQSPPFDRLHDGRHRLDELRDLASRSAPD